MTYNVSSGMLNSTILYHINCIFWHLMSLRSFWVVYSVNKSALRLMVYGGCEGECIQGSGDRCRQKVKERSTETCQRLRRTFPHAGRGSNGMLQSGRPYRELYTRQTSSSTTVKCLKSNLLSHHDKSTGFMQWRCPSVRLSIHFLSVA